MSCAFLQLQIFYNAVILLLLRHEYNAKNVYLIVTNVCELIDKWWLCNNCRARDNYEKKKGKLFLPFSKFSRFVITFIAGISRLNFAKVSRATFYFLCFCSSERLASRWMNWLAVRIIHWLHGNWCVARRKWDWIKCYRGTSYKWRMLYNDRTNWTEPTILQTNERDIPRSRNAKCLALSYGDLLIFR